MTQCLRGFLLVLILLTLPAGRAFAMGTESFGNAPVSPQEGWAKGVVAVASAPSRFFTQWINGNESFYYLGNTDALNEALKLFARVEVPAREVVILPGPGEARTFHGARLPCDWRLMVPSGIYLHRALKETGSDVFVKHPTLTVFLSPGRIELEGLSIPPGLKVIGERELLEKYRSGLKSPDPEVRGQAAYLLGSFPEAEEILLPLIDGLKDPDDYVVLSAGGALGAVGRAAAPALPALREHLESRKENVRQSLQEAIRRIEAAQTKESKAHRALNEKISRFTKALNAERAFPPKSQ